MLPRGYLGVKVGIVLGKEMKYLAIDFEGDFSTVFTMGSVEKMLGS